MTILQRLIELIEKRREYNAGKNNHFYIQLLVSDDEAAELLEKLKGEE